jgi:hypothetical protein
MKLEDAREFWRSRGVPEEAIEDLWSMAEAARFNDAQAEEYGAETVVQQCGWHPEAVAYLSTQRAMRMLAAAKPGGAEALREFARSFQPALFTGMNDDQLIAVASVWIDGFCNAANATRLRGDGADDDR